MFLPPLLNGCTALRPYAQCLVAESNQVQQHIGDFLRGHRASLAGALLGRVDHATAVTRAIARFAMQPGHLCLHTDSCTFVYKAVSIAEFQGPKQ